MPRTPSIRPLAWPLLLVAVLAACGDGGGGGGGGGPLPSVDITGNWLILRYHFTSAPTETPPASELDETRFTQEGSTFTQFFGPDDTVGFDGTFVDGEYVQTGPGFTARLRFQDADHGTGTYEQGALTTQFVFARVAGAAHDVAGAWVANDETVDATVTLSGDALTVDLGGERLTGRLGGDTGLLLGDPQPANGALAARLVWASDASATLTRYESSWTPDGAGHTGFSTSETTLTLSRAPIDDTCTDDEDCPDALYCVAGECHDGSTGDPCRASSDCLAAAELCDTTCRAREPGELCGPGDACPSALYCLDSRCWAGATGDPCRTAEDCTALDGYCGGEPLVCRTGLGPGADCDPFDPFPTGACREDLWCEPQAGEPASGGCVDAREGTSTQGVACSGPDDCADGFSCAPTRECVRYCASEGDDGCGDGQACLTAYDGDGETVPGVLFCQPPCDYDAGIACDDPARACVPGEATLPGRDQCLDPTTELGIDAWLSPDDSCVDAGMEDGTLCSDLAICNGGICTRICRHSAGMLDVVGHPDCNWGTCLEAVAELGLCENTCTDGAVPFLNEGFDFASFRGDIVGEVERAGWADFDFPNIADDEATGGTDGDAGLAFRGWINQGSGSYAFNLESPQNFALPGNLWFAHADVHIEPGFNPTSFALEVTWFGAPAGGSGIRPTLGTDSLDLMPELTAGNNPTDHSEWFRVGLETVMPASADLAQLRIYFGGTTDIGGFQAARIDHVVLGLCDQD